MSIAIIDLEGLIIDVPSLALAVCRSVLGWKIPEHAIEQFSCVPIKEAARCFLIDDGSEFENVSTIVERVMSEMFDHADLCRPRFGSYSFLRFLKDQDITPFFITLNPDIDLRALNSSSNSHGMFDSHLKNLDTLRIGSSEGCDIIYILADSFNLHLIHRLNEMLRQENCFLFCKSRTLLNKLLGPESDQSIKLYNSVEEINSPLVMNSSEGVTESYPSKVLPMMLHQPVCPEKYFWHANRILKTPTIFEGTVIPAMGRGRTQLGIPTANLDNHDPIKGEPLPFPGVYFGFASLCVTDKAINPPACMQTIISAGYNPYFDNADLSVVCCRNCVVCMCRQEAYLFHEFDGRFDGAKLRIG